MTVISTILSKENIIFSADSLVNYKINKTYTPKTFNALKILPIEKYRAGLAYWGLAEISGNDTIDWFKSRLKETSNDLTLEGFIKFIFEALKEELNKSNNKGSGIGIHIAGFEEFNNKKIPELYLISNFKDPIGQEVKDLYMGRQSYSTLIKRRKLIRTNDPLQQREFVLQYVEAGGFFTYNNGDPILFNTISGAIQNGILELKRRNRLKQGASVETLRKLARRPIEIIRNLQKDFCKEGTILVGGNIYDLVIPKSGRYKGKCRKSL